MTTSNFHHKISQNINKQYENFKKIDEFIEELHVKMLKISKVHEEKILNDYKQEMARAKENFNKVSVERNQEFIHQNINKKKNQLEKECAASIKKSLEIAKIYQTLKQKWSQVNSAQHEMQLQKKYLLKQIKRCTKDQSQLQTEVMRLRNQVQNKFLMKRNRNNTILCPYPTRDNIQTLQELPSRLNIPILSIKNNQQIQKKHQIMKKTHNFQVDRENRIKKRIQQKNELMNSLAFNFSPLEQIFIEQDLQASKTPKQKLNLIQAIFSIPETKKKLYHIIFGQERSKMEQQKQCVKNIR